jgi:hypothetical protein
MCVRVESTIFVRRVLREMRILASLVPSHSKPRYLILKEPTIVSQSDFHSHSSMLISRHQQTVSFALSNILVVLSLFVLLSIFNVFSSNGVFVSAGYATLNSTAVTISTRCMFRTTGSGCNFTDPSIWNNNIVPTNGDTALLVFNLTSTNTSSSPSLFSNFPLAFTLYEDLQLSGLYIYLTPNCPSSINFTTIYFYLHDPITLNITNALILGCNSSLIVPPGALLISAATLIESSASLYIEGSSGQVGVFFFSFFLPSFRSHSKLSDVSSLPFSQLPYDAILNGTVRIESYSPSTSLTIGTISTTGSVFVNGSLTLSYTGSELNILPSSTLVISNTLFANNGLLLIQGSLSVPNFEYEASQLLLFGTLNITNSGLTLDCKYSLTSLQISGTLLALGFASFTNCEVVILGSLHLVEPPKNFTTFNQTLLVKNSQIYFQEQLTYDEIRVPFISMEYMSHAISHYPLMEVNNSVICGIGDIFVAPTTTLAFTSNSFLFGSSDGGCPLLENSPPQLLRVSSTGTGNPSSAGFTVEMDQTTTIWVSEANNTWVENLAIGGCLNLSQGGQAKISSTIVNFYVGEIFPSSSFTKTFMTYERIITGKADDNVFSYSNVEGRLRTTKACSRAFSPSFLSLTSYFPKWIIVQQKSL